MQKRDIVTETLMTLAMLMAMYFCPLMNGYAGKPEDPVSGDLLTLGLELTHFSAAGVVPFVLIPIFFFGRGVLARVRVRAVLLAVGLVCYVYSFCLTKAWLVTVSDVPVTYEYGAAVFPLILVTAAAWTLRGTFGKHSA